MGRGPNHTTMASYGRGGVGHGGSPSAVPDATATLVQRWKEPGRQSMEIKGRNVELRPIPPGVSIEICVLACPAL